MTCRNPALLNLINTGVLGTICVVGICGLDIVSGDQPASETEEFRELSEYEDADDQSAVGYDEVTLDQTQRIDQWLHAEQETASFWTGWKWCSRGPPAA